VIIAIIIAATAAFLYYVSSKPDSFALQRQISINALPADIYPWINNLKNMNQWNPWSTQDVKSVIAYEGPEEGPGAVYTWAGGKMGQGKFQIVDTKSPTQIDCRLLMIKPMAADNMVKFNLTPSSGPTTVTWSMSGKKSFVNKLMHTVMNMDKMVGRDFDKGLANLKSLVEQKKLH
jgi:Polyketide cyclase / dehydrase and lipid transport